MFEKLKKMVYDIDIYEGDTTRNQCREAERAVRENSDHLTNDEFDELMMEISFKYRYAYQH